MGECMGTGGWEDLDGRRWNVEDEENFGLNAGSGSASTSRTSQLIFGGDMAIHTRSVIYRGKPISALR
jgi:hypothetical protein